MGVLTIDGVGRVEVGPEFGRLSPEQQNATVEGIIAQFKGGAAPPPPPAVDPAAQEAEQTAAAAMGIQTKPQAPTDIVERGTILPIGITGEGKAVPALPEFIEGPRRTIMDLIEGKRQAKDISGKEMFELGALLAGGSVAGGTGRGIAREAGRREAEGGAAALREFSGPGIPGLRSPGKPTPSQVAEAASPAAVNQTAKLATQLADEAATAIPAAEVKAAITSAAEAKAAAKGNYAVADAAELVLSDATFRPVVQATQREAAKAGMDKTLTPDSVAALGRLTEVMNKPIAFQDLMTLREVANVAAGATRPKDQNIAQIILNNLDDYVAKLSAKDVFAGATDPQVAARAVAKAREDWSKFRKLDTVAALVQRAQDRVAQRPALGLENTLRNEFTNLSTNKRAMSRLTPEEQNAVRQVTRGATKTIARSIGRLAPTGPVSGMFAGGAVTALGAKLGLDAFSAAAVMIPPAFAARKLAAVLTQRSIKNLEELIAAGSQSEVATQAIARARSLSEALAGQINTGIQGQAVTQPSNPDIVRGLQSASRSLGMEERPTIGGSLSLAMSAMPAARIVAGNPSQVVKLLEEALLKDSGAGFPALYQQLKALPAPELKAIAKEFVGGSFSSSSEALKKIWSVHHALELRRSKSLAVGGRSAG